MVWLGFFEKNVFLRTSGVRAKPSKRISTFSVAKGLIDHISETYHLMCSKFGSSVHFILLGDTNDLKLDQIVNISPYQAQSR